MVDFGKILEYLGGPAITTPAGAVSNGAVIAAVSALAGGTALAATGIASSLSNQRIIIEQWNNQSAPSTLDKLTGFLKKHKKGVSGLAALGVVGALLGISQMAPKKPVLDVEYGETSLQILSCMDMMMAQGLSREVALKICSPWGEGGLDIYGPPTPSRNWYAAQTQVTRAIPSGETAPAPTIFRKPPIGNDKEPVLREKGLIGAAGPAMAI